MADESNTNGTSKRGRKPAKYSLATLKATTQAYQRGDFEAVKASGYELIEATKDDKGFIASHPVLRSPNVLRAEDNTVEIVRFVSEGDYSMTPTVEVIGSYAFDGKRFVKAPTAE